MNTENKQGRIIQKSIKDFTSKQQCQGIKCSRTSPSLTEPNTTNRQQNTLINMNPSEQSELPISAATMNEDGQVLKGVLGPLVNMLKLLRELMDAKYERLEEKYTSLETAISQQKSDVTSEILKLEQSLASERMEMSKMITKKLEDNTEKLGEVIEENK